jgi:hypothetical protein
MFGVKAVVKNEKQLGGGGAEPARTAVSAVPSDHHIGTETETRGEGGAATFHTRFGLDLRSISELR